MSKDKILSIRAFGEIFRLLLFSKFALEFSTFSLREVNKLNVVRWSDRLQIMLGVSTAYETRMNPSVTKTGHYFA